MTFFPLVGLDLLVSLLLLRVWKSKKESVVDPEAHSFMPRITPHKDYAWQALCTASVLNSAKILKSGRQSKIE